MRILALDMATKTGWATNSPLNASGVDIFDVKRGESPGTRYLRFVKWLREKIEIIKPELIVFEKAHHRGGASTEIAAGFATHLQSTCADLDVEFMAVHSATLKKFATGRGNANKNDMMFACEKKLGVKPDDDNHADALWLLRYGQKEIAS